MPAPPSFTVTGDESGSRLDAFLAFHLRLSLRRAREILQSPGVLINARRAPKGSRLQSGQVVTLAGPMPAEAPILVPMPGVPLDVIQQDAFIVGVNKPAGIPSHPLRAGEGATVAAALIARFPECATASEDPREGGLGHRLDTGTSGVIIAARSPEAWRALRHALSDPGCEKLYLAEVIGTPPESEIVAEPIGRLGAKGRRVAVGKGRDLLPARTELRRITVRAGGATSLVEARLHAGRPHQVRAHLAHLGFPVVGDTAYGAPATATAPGFHLHAHVVRFESPADGARVEIEAPPPAWVQAQEQRR